MILLAADAINEASVDQLFLAGKICGGLITAVVTIYGAAKLLANAFREEKKPSAEQLLRRDTALSKEDKDFVLNELHTRMMVIILVMALAIFFCIAGYFLYNAIVIPRKDLPQELTIESAAAIQPASDEWYTNYRILQQAADELIPSKGTSQGSQEQVIRIQTKSFGSHTDNHPTNEKRCYLKFNTTEYDFRPPVAVILKKGDGVPGLVEVKVKEESDGLHFSLPPSDSEDVLLFIGRVTHKSKGAIPNLDQFFSIYEEKGK